MSDYDQGFVDGTENGYRLCEKRIAKLVAALEKIARLYSTTPPAAIACEALAE